MAYLKRNPVLAVTSHVLRRLTVAMLLTLLLVGLVGETASAQRTSWARGYSQGVRVATDQGQRQQGILDGALACRLRTPPERRQRSYAFNEDDYNAGYQAGFNSVWQQGFDAIYPRCAGYPSAG